MKTTVLYGALSWCSIQVLSMLRRICATFSWVFQGLPNKTFHWHFVLVAQIPCGRSLDCQKTNEQQFDFGFSHFRFLGRGEFTVCYDFGVLSRGSYSKIHDSSCVITRLKNYGSLSRRSIRSWHKYFRLAFCSGVRFFGTILAHTFLMSKSCVKIWWTVNRYQFNSLLVILKVNRRSDLTRDLTVSTLSSVFEVKSFPAWGRFLLVLGRLKRTCALERECSPKPFVTFHKSQ